MQKTSKGFAAQPFGRSNFKGSTFSHVWRGWKASGWLARCHTWRWKKTLCNRSSNERRTPKENEELAESVSILVKSLHFSFIAMKRWKFQIHCDECDEILKERKMIILIVSKHELEHSILYITNFDNYKPTLVAISITNMSIHHFQKI